MSASRASVSLLHPRWSGILPVLLSGLCFYGGGMLGLTISRGTDGIAALWPANGVLLAALILARPGTRRFHLLACAIASTYVNWRMGTTLDLALIFTAANLTTAATADALLRRWRCGPDLLQSITGIAKFLLVVMVTVCLGASIAAMSIGLHGLPVGATWLNWASSDLIGTVLIVSFVLTSVRYWHGSLPELQAVSRWEIAMALLAVIVITLAVFAQARFPLLFVPLAVLMLATYRLGLLGAVGGTLTIGLIGSVLTGAGLGPVALIAGGVALKLQFLQIYLVTLYATCLPLALLLTERRELNRRLSESDRRHRRILDRSRDVIFETDLNGRWTYLNPAWASVTGLPVEQSLGRSFLSAIAEPDREAALQRLKLLYAGDVDECCQEVRYLHGERDERWVSVRSRLLTDESGVVIGTHGTLQDVTESRRAETALRETSDRLARNNRMLTMAETVAALGHWRIDIAAGLTFWSDEAYRIHGLPLDWPLGLEKVMERYHPDDRDRVRSTVETALAEGRPFTFRARFVQPTGKVVHVLLRGEVDRAADNAVTGFFGIIQDVSEQAETEALLLDREARFRLITEQASDIISLHTIDGTCRFVSPAARTVLGYEPDVILGTAVRRYVVREDRASLATLRRQLETSPAGTVSSTRLRMRRGDGSIIWVEAAARLADHMGVTHVVSVCRDISAQVTAEADLREARRLAEAAAHAKSDFLANMSHEIRTPMNGVLGFTDLLLASDLTVDQRRHAALIADSGRAMMRLLNDILDLSKVEAGQMKVADEPVDLRHALNACMKLIMPAAAQKGLALQNAFAPDLPSLVRTDGLRLRQIVLNLLGNAVKFTQEGGITLSCSIGDGVVPTIVIDVQDTGIGIAPDRQAAVFEQFVQADTGTASRFGGTGLGLAISSRLARLMGGDLSLQSAVGVGTRFTLTLPLAVAETDAPGRIVEPIEAARPIPQGIRVLVAEDHDVNQMLITAMLERLGCVVDIAENGAIAVARISAAASRGEPYALVLMDMQMPELDGLSATRRVRAAGISATQLPIVALTANAYADDIAACLDAGMQAHAAKPLQLVTLETLLRRWTPMPAPVVQRSAARFSAKIEARYRERKAELLAQLEGMLRTGSLSDADMAEVVDQHHKLAGTAGMFGDDALGALALAFEAAAPGWSADVRAARVAAHIAAMRRLSMGDLDAVG